MVIDMITTIISTSGAFVFKVKQLVARAAGKLVFVCVGVLFFFAGNAGVGLGGQNPPFGASGSEVVICDSLEAVSRYARKVSCSVWRAAGK